MSPLAAAVHLISVTRVIFAADVYCPHVAATVRYIAFSLRFRDYNTKFCQRGTQTDPRDPVPQSEEDSSILCILYEAAGVARGRPFNYSSPLNMCFPHVHGPSSTSAAERNDA